ncbi:MAG TPA: hypothetical protein VEL06_08575 [Haliangiales bacterium]|nr:hypothetical protein [Haliangiales bacterium]
MPAMTDINSDGSLVTGEIGQGIEFRGNTVRLMRHLAVFEIYNLALVLRLSEVLTNFKIVANDVPLYVGRAVVNNLLYTATLVICEATLDESGWIDVDFNCVRNGGVGLAKEYENFVRRWQKNYKVTQPFKLIIADMRTFFMDMQLWLDQVELGIRASPSGDRSKLEQAVTDELASAIIPSINTLFEKFENAAQNLEPHLLPIHSSYMRRQLHPFVLCAPFPHRTFCKPLGYAGDYEMVNMIARDVHEGGSLYAKIVNCWFLKQPPAQAHRNRLRYLQDKLIEETLRVMRAGRQARICNLACGPAVEVQRFLDEQEISNQAHFSLIDFNDETLEHAQMKLDSVKARHYRRSSVQYVKKSVQRILRDSVRTFERPPQDQYDFVYCAGLYDYLPDQVCRLLTDLLYEWVAPGGLLLLTNVEPSNPLRNGMEHLLDWHLVYRTGRQFEALQPKRASADSVAVRADLTGVNLFLEVRKPDHAKR